MTRENTLSRRALLSAVPASGLAATLPEIARANAPDPLVPLYREWLDARRTWRELSHLPGNENWDDPRSVAAQDRENAAERRMLELRPTSQEGIAALAALAWVYVGPGYDDPERNAELAQGYDCRAVLAIWKACTGRDGPPDI